MSTVESISAAIAELPPEQVAQIRDWLNERGEAEWDAQIEADEQAGRLDALADKALKNTKPKLPRLITQLIWSALLSTSFITRVAAEEPALYPISVEGKWGYIDAQGRVVIQPQFLKANKFSEGLAVVAVAGTSDEDRVFERKYEGFIGPDGKFVIPPEPPPEARKLEDFETHTYDDFHEGLAKIRISSSGVNGFIDRTGKVVIPLKFDTLWDFSEGLAFVHVWKHWSDERPRTGGFIDKRGQWVIKNNDIRSSYGFCEGRAAVSVPTKDNDYAMGLIDQRGKFVIPVGMYNLGSPVAGAIRAVKEGKVGLLDINGKVIVPLGKYDQILEPEEGNVFTAELGDKTVLIDATGKRLADVAAPGNVGRFHGGIATIKQGERSGYIDRSGAVRIAPQFDVAGPFDRGLALVKSGKMEGYINLEGKFVWKTDRWDEPLRNAVSKPLSTFLPENTVKALPLSYNWERVKNAIVFVADGTLDDLHAWYKQRCTGELRLTGEIEADEGESRKLDLTVFRPDAGFLEVFAMAGTDNAESVHGFVEFYSCENMNKLRAEYPKKVIGILIEN